MSQSDFDFKFYGTASKPSIISPVWTETTLPPLSVHVDMCYYSNLLDLVPPEACSVPLILHCMLEQVCVQVIGVSLTKCDFSGLGEIKSAHK